MNARTRMAPDAVTVRRYAAPGQCLESQPFGSRGTIGIIGVDLLTGRKVALTAMHIVPGLAAYPTPAFSGVIEVESPCVNGTGPIVGRLLRGTMAGIDAAVIDIEGQVVSNFLSGVGIVKFWRSVSPVMDRNRPVRMVGAASGKVQHGRILSASEPVPSMNLTSAIVVEMTAFHGDSGAPLVDENNRLIGMLVGGNPTRQLFCPIEMVFDRLSCKLFQG